MLYSGNWTTFCVINSFSGGRGDSSNRHSWLIRGLNGGCLNDTLHSIAEMPKGARVRARDEGISSHPPNHMS